MTMLKQRSRSYRGTSSSRHRLAGIFISPAALLLLRGDVLTTATATDATVDWVKFADDTAAATAATVATKASKNASALKFADDAAAATAATKASKNAGASSNLRQQSIAAVHEFNDSMDAIVRQELDSNNIITSSNNVVEQRILTGLKERSTSCTTPLCGECQGDCNTDADCEVSVQFYVLCTYH